MCYQNFGYLRKKKNRLRMIEMVDMKETGIKEIVLDEIKEYAIHFEIKKIILFGSRARGDYKEKSDIDL